jgi:hypothetical protein
MQTNIREELLREIVDALSEAFLCNLEREEIHPQDVGNVEDPFKAY